MKKILIAVIGLSLIACGEMPPRRTGGMNNGGNNTNGNGNTNTNTSPTAASKISGFTYTLSAASTEGSDQATYAISVGKRDAEKFIHVKCFQKATDKQPSAENDAAVQDDLLNHAIDAILDGRAVIKSEPKQPAGNTTASAIEYVQINADKTTKTVKVTDPVVYQGSAKSDVLGTLVSMASDLCHS